MVSAKSLAGLLAVVFLAGCNAGGLKTYALDSGTPTRTYDGVMLGTVGEVYKDAHAFCGAYEKRAQLLEDGVPDGTVTFACLD